MPSAALKLPDFAGVVFHKRYQFTTLLGSGSYGVVYKAVDLEGTLGDRERAVKLVSKRGRNSSWCESFRSEMAIHKLASEHPNVITLHDAYEDDEWFVFVMDCCGGGDLATYIQTHGPYRDETKLRNAFLTLVDTVDWLHSRKIYHRDLKPQNILVNEDGTQLFVADFGLASEDNAYDQPCGTPGYMPPGELRVLDRLKMTVKILTPHSQSVSKLKAATFALARKATPGPWASSSSSCCPGTCHGSERRPTTPSTPTSSRTPTS